MTLTKTIEGYAVLGVLGVVLAVVAYKALKSGALVGAASNVAGGTVQEAGTLIGVPKTNEAQCAACKSSNDLYGVSKYCSASDFISASKNRLLGRNLDGTPKSGPVLDETAAETARLNRVNDYNPALMDSGQTLYVTPYQDDMRAMDGPPNPFASPYAYGA